MNENSKEENNNNNINFSKTPKIITKTKARYSKTPKTSRINSNYQQIKKNKNNSKIFISELNNSKNQNNLENKLNYSSSSTNNIFIKSNSEKDFNKNSLIENEILNLYKEYFKYKNFRQQSENDFNILSNKINMLSKEEKKISDKKNIFLKNLEKKEKIQFNNLKEKELLMKNKILKEKNLQEHKLKNNLFKDNRDKILKNFRKNVQQKNFDIIHQLRNEYKKNYNLFKQEEKEKLNKRHNNVIKINKERAKSIENKKQIEYEKKLKLKNELLKKILEEQKKKEDFDIYCENLQNQSIELINKIKDISEDFIFTNNNNLNSESLNSNSERLSKSIKTNKS